MALLWTIYNLNQNRGENAQDQDEYPLASLEVAYQNSDKQASDNRFLLWNFCSVKKKNRVLTFLTGLAQNLGQ